MICCLTVLVKVELLKWVSAMENFVIVYLCSVGGSAVPQGAASYSAVVMRENRPFEKGGDAPLKAGTSRVGAEGRVSRSACVCL